MKHPDTHLIAEDNRIRRAIEIVRASLLYYELEQYLSMLDVAICANSPDAEKWALIILNFAEQTNDI